MKDVCGVYGASVTSVLWWTSMEEESIRHDPCDIHTCGTRFCRVDSRSAYKTLPSHTGEKLGRLQLRLGEILGTVMADRDVVQHTTRSSCFRRGMRSSAGCACLWPPAPEVQSAHICFFRLVLSSSKVVNRTCSSLQQLFSSLERAHWKGSFMPPSSMEQHMFRRNKQMLTRYGQVFTRILWCS